MKEMNQEEVSDFLEEKNLAILGTLRPDGSPHMTPVWFSYDGSHIYITTADGRVKVSNIKNDSRVSILITNQSGSKVVIIEGIAEVYEDHEGQRTKFMAERYIQDPSQRKDMIDWLMKDKRITIKTSPKKTTSWDVGKS